jgi:sugar phosphate isomerase/epimerase
MAHRLKQAICNEAFEGWNFADTCKAVKRAGYDGIEIAPFTLSWEPASITTAERHSYRAILEAEGLTFVGLHWLMVAPKGLHVTTPDAALRERSWRHIRDLIDLCADLGGNGVMVFGSPAQRATTGGATRDEATRRYVDGLAQVAPHAQDCGVTILMEALPAGQCDVVVTLEEAAGYVREIGSPAVRTMFDVHNAIDEVEPHAALVDRHFDLIRHVHINELDGRYPGAGDYDFRPVFETLLRRKFQGFVSAEVFDFTPGGEKIAGESLRHVERVLATISI